MKVLYLSTGETMDINLTPRKKASRLDKFDSAITEILKGYSFPKPEDPRECPRCPHYFICSTAKNA
jgi:CRISPR/Cas system-associated exonuclease Cas4 (RecB family)